MSLSNATPFAAEFFRQFNMVGALNGVVAVRGTFDIVPDGTISVSSVQVPFQWSDEYEGEPQDSHLVTPADFVPYKPGTDVTVLGVTYAPGGEAATDWVCGIRVGTRLEKLVRVHGTRYWEPKVKPPRPSLIGREAEAQFEGWAMTRAEPATVVPLSWRLAFGGARPLRPGEAPPAEKHPDNGLGPGLLDLHHSPHDARLPAPRIEEVDDPVVDWRQDHVPQGFAPVPPWWLCRRKHAGTIDDRWIKERHPILPEDFDFRFWQVAPPGLVAEPWLGGDEVLQFAYMHPEIELLQTRLPGLSLSARVQHPGHAAQDHPLVLDGVHVDFRRGADRVTLTWRTAFACESDDARIVLTLAGGERSPA